MKHLIFFLFLSLSTPHFAQDTVYVDSSISKTAAASQVQKEESRKSITNTPTTQNPTAPDWIDIVKIIIPIFVFLFAVYQFIIRKSAERKFERIRLEEKARFEEQLEDYKIEMAEKIAEAEDKGHNNFQKSEENINACTAEQIFKSALLSELGSIRLLGAPDIDSIPVRLFESFVNLRISDSWRTEEQYRQSKRMEFKDVQNLDFTPDEIIKRAFLTKRMLLIIGDPGCGKTTLLKYYSMICLEGNAAALDLPEKIIVLYLSLRKLDISLTLSANFAAWAKDHECDIHEDVFYQWLHKQETLILLDGLDEISDTDKRRKACGWIDARAAGLEKARFIVTSRWTGYDKLDSIELGFDHLRADIKEFNWEQQQEFLRKWFKAVAKVEQPPSGAASDWQESQLKLAAKKAQDLINHLKRKENQAIRKLADSPLLLQIIAILGRERGFRAHDRTELFRAALNYLLDFRDRKRDLNPLLPAKQAVSVLAPTAYWMQREIERDDVPRNKMHEQLQPLIKPIKEELSAQAFCKNLCERAGILAELGESDYIFRHKSFREYLTGLQILKQAGDAEFLKEVVDNFDDAWWKEPLRFFMGEADVDIFDDFMNTLFKSSITKELDQDAQNLLDLLVKDAPARKTNALAERLDDSSTNENQKRYILNCLKAIGTQEAKGHIKNFTSGQGAVAAYARELTAESEVPKIVGAPQKEIDLFQTLPAFFRSPSEENAEYILIPGGSYEFSVTEEKVTLPNIYFAKYAVTNKRYNRFISFLKGKAGELNELLEKNCFVEELLRFTKIEEGYKKYLDNDPKQWPGKMASKEDRKKFLGADQPVVGVTWYDAMAYSLWLTLLQAAAQKGGKKVTLDDAVVHFRLPHEKEWVWAAYGEPDGTLRKFPWPGDKATPKLANYKGSVGATTPVGRYPDGATPHGLMDMAGNVWEGQGNRYDREHDWCALRGGSWYSLDGYLRCSARNNFCYPDYYWLDYGFRVVLSESNAFDTLEL